MISDHKLCHEYLWRGNKIKNQDMSSSFFFKTANVGCFGWLIWQLQSRYDGPGMGRTILFPELSKILINVY